VESIKTVTAPTSQAVTNEEADSQLKVDSSDDTAYINSLIIAAQNQVEEYTNRRLIEGKYELIFEKFDKDITLPYSPIKTIESIKYYDIDNNIQTFASASYDYDIYSLPCIISAVDSWPGTYVRKDAVTVQFTTGYTTPDAIPGALKQAILLLITDMYENRIDQPRERFTAWQRLAYPYRVFYD